MRIRGFLLSVVLGISSFAAMAQTDSLSAPKDKVRFKEFNIPAVKAKDSVASKQRHDPPKSLQQAVAENKQKDSLVLQSKAKPGFIRKTVLPVSMIAVGVLISKSAFERSVKNEVQDALGNNFHTKIDDYTRYAPIVQLYAADAFGVKAKNHWFDQTKNLAISYIITDFVINSLKDNVHKIRPDVEMGDGSFPSAHTAQAFTTAAVLYEEFKDTSPLLAYSGYAFATATGTMRIMNNAHWFSDVVVGAGIGILVTKLVYMLDPIIKWNPFKKKKDITILPQIAGNGYGVYVGYKF